MRTGMKKFNMMLFTALMILFIMAPQITFAATYSISIRDVTITPEDLDIGDTVNIKVNYRVEGDDTNIKLYLYVDDILEKTYTRSHYYDGSYTYTFYFDSDDLDDSKHEIEIKAKLYDDDDDLRDTDTYTQNIYFDEDYDDDTTDYNINIQDITISPTTPHVGDTISIKAKFDIDSPTSSSLKVKSYLYIDDHLEKTATGTYYDGTRYYTFTFDTDDLDRGVHDIKIKQELYRDSWLRDTDSETESIYLDEKRGVIHDLDFTSILYETPVNSKESIPITVTVKNTGNTDEESTRIKLILGSKTVQTSTFYLRAGSSTTKTIYIETPEESGSHELIISAYNTDVEEKTIQHVDTKGYEISLKTSPEDEAYVGDWIKISGQAREDDKATTQKITIYIDDVYEKTIIPASNGNYEDYVKFDTPGFHKITAEIRGTRDDKIIRILEKSSTTEQPAGTPGETQVTVSEGEPYTIIIVREGTDRVYVDGTEPQPEYDNETKEKIEELEKNIDDINTKLEENEKKLDETGTSIEEIKTDAEESKNTLLAKLDDLKNALAEMLKAEREEWERQMQEEQEQELKYVDIETSSKELVVNRYGANTLTLSITNHLGKTESFTVTTDFPEDWVFLPKTEVISNKATEKLYIHFNPTGEKGYYDGTITVKASDSTIKEIPLKLYITEEKKAAAEKEDDKDFIGPDSLGGMLLLAALFMLTMFILYINRRTIRPKKKNLPLEPVLPREPFMKIPSEQTTEQKEPFWRKEQYKKPFETVKESIMEKFSNSEKPQTRRKQLGKVYYVSWNNVIQ